MPMPMPMPMPMLRCRCRDFQMALKNVKHGIINMMLIVLMEFAYSIDIPEHITHSVNTWQFKQMISLTVASL